MSVRALQLRRTRKGGSVRRPAANPRRHTQPEVVIAVLAHLGGGAVRERRARAAPRDLAYTAHGGELRDVFRGARPVAEAAGERLRHRRRRGETGSVTFVQRFDGALGSFVSLHVVALDGVFTRTKDDAVVFPPGPTPSAADVAAVVARVAEPMLRWMRRRKRFDDRPSTTASDRRNEWVWASSQARNETSARPTSGPVQRAIIARRRGRLRLMCQRKR
jgi:hypothetical protein